MAAQSGQQFVALGSSGALSAQGSGAVLSAVNTSGGTVTLNGATAVTVANAAVTANSIIIFTLKTAHTPGAYPAIATITPGTGFTVAGTAGDVSVYNYAILG